MDIGKKIERTRGRVKLAEIARKVRPAERADELAEREHRQQLARQARDFKIAQREEDRKARQGRRDAKRDRRRARRAQIWASITGLFQANLGWLTAQWVALRGWIADRIVVVPVLVAGGSALYGQYGYLHDPTSPQYPGDSTGMGWASPVALAAGLAVEVMAFVLFRARKRGLDAGDDVRVETAAGWAIVSGAVWFNATHVDPLAGFLSAIGPIAWEIRERRERRNREIENGTRGKAPAPLPWLGLRFRRHYRAEATAMLRVALWERARRSYPRLVAMVETQADETRLAQSIEQLTNLVSANPVQLANGVSSHAVLAIEPGSDATGFTAPTARTSEPGSRTEPGSATPAHEPGSGKPGSATGFSATGTPRVDVLLVDSGETGPASLPANPVWKSPQASARFTPAEPGSATAPSTTVEPGSGTLGGEPGSPTGPDSSEPGSTDTAAAEPGSAVTAGPGSSEPGSPTGAAVTSNPVRADESELEQTRPMPVLVKPSAEPGSDNRVRYLHALPANEEDAAAVQVLVNLCVELLDREGRWVSRDDQMAYLREQGQTVPNRLRDAWWAQMRGYRALVKTPKTG